MENRGLPVYQCHVKTLEWEMDYKADPPKKTGRVTVSYCAPTEEFMLRCEERDDALAERLLFDWYDRVKSGPRFRKTIIKALSWKAEYIGHREWAAGWFMHYSKIIFKTEKEAFKSFGDYVSEIRRKSDGLDYKDRERAIGALMGAENRFRWEITKPEETEWIDENQVMFLCNCPRCGGSPTIEIGH